MKIQSKQIQGSKTYTQDKREYKNVYVDWSKHEIDPYSIIPYGKYFGQTLEFVRREDDRYYRWIEDNHLIENWGLYKKKTSPPTKEYQGLVYCEKYGGYMIELIEIVNQTK